MPCPFTAKISDFNLEIDRQKRDPDEDFVFLEPEQFDAITEHLLHAACPECVAETTVILKVNAFINEWAAKRRAEKQSQHT